MENKEKNKKQDKKEIEEANIEKNKVDVKAQSLVNATKGIPPVKFGVEIIDIINDAKNVKAVKNISDVFVNGLKSTLIFMAIGSLIGGAINMAIIIYEGKKLSNICEKYLIEDNGVEFIKAAINDYNNGINYFKNKAGIKD
jgi:biotin synthase-related radical SAM superfamily protein